MAICRFTSNLQMLPAVPQIIVQFGRQRWPKEACTDGNFMEIDENVGVYYIDNTPLKCI